MSSQSQIVPSTKAYPLNKEILLYTSKLVLTEPKTNQAIRLNKIITNQAPTSKKIELTTKGRMICL
jgi:hypothetical protein